MLVTLSFLYDENKFYFKNNTAKNIFVDLLFKVIYRKILNLYLLKFVELKLTLSII